jgi:hypothetical protein
MAEVNFQMAEVKRLLKNQLAVGPGGTGPSRFTDKPGCAANGGTAYTPSSEFFNSHSTLNTKAVSAGTGQRTVAPG